MRLIDRDELMSVISEIKSVVEFDGPIEEVQVKGEKYEKVRHGRWQIEGYTVRAGKVYSCTECGRISRHNGNYEYCPNCGARMDRGSEDVDG